ncbi:MAG TPA: hypothetical protein VFM70_10860 [Salinimicrobium sp.]|nr:hypothetical protein [Salinimicrobium sp.]
MKKLFLVLSMSLLCFLVSCSDEDDPFLITNDRVGKLTKDIKINELETLYADDSLVNQPLNPQYVDQGTDIEIYGKEGNLMLVLQPVQEFDTTSTIGNIQIVDPRFKTKKGLNIESSFGDIVENYSISRIENTLSSAVVFIDEINAYISIDKKNLPAALRFDTDSKIEKSQIPDDAKFKYFMIGWN